MLVYKTNIRFVEVLIGQSLNCLSEDYNFNNGILNLLSIYKRTCVFTTCITVTIYFCIFETQLAEGQNISHMKLKKLFACEHMAIYSLLHYHS